MEQIGNSDNSLVRIYSSFPYLHLKAYSGTSAVAWNLLLILIILVHF